MGCLCSKPLADDLGAARADVRARHSLDALRHDADMVNGVHALQQQTPAVPTTLSNTAILGRSRSSDAVPLSRSQWKQMRALARSNTNPHYHQLQQLQLLPSHALYQQQQQRHQQQTAAFDDMLAGLQRQHSHHPPIAHVTVGLAEGLNDLPRRQGSDFGSTATYHHSANNLRSQAAATRTVLSPEQVLALCGAVVQDYGPALVAAGIHPLLLASVCLIESGGCPQARQYREHVGEVALGLGQVLLSTAQWLASSQGFDKYGTPTAADLEDPKCSLYFCAAYLAVLSQHHGLRRSESFLIKAYHAGPKGVHTEDASLYWQKYLKAKHCLKEVARAMAVTVATAAAAAGQRTCFQLFCNVIEAPAYQLMPSSHADVVAKDACINDQTRSGKDSDVATSMDADAAAVGDKLDGSKGNSTSSRTSCDSATDDSSGTTNLQVMIWSNAAVLIEHLSSSWEGSTGVAATAADSAIAAGHAESEASSNSGSFIAQLLPSFWQSASSSRSQLQQHTGNSSNAAAVRGSSRRRQQSDGASSEIGCSSSASRGFINLVPVSRAALSAALTRLRCIDHNSLCTALNNAATAVQLHSSWVTHPAGGAFPAPTAGRGSSTSWPQRLRNSFAGSTSSAAVKCTNAAVPPYTMHVVGQNETVTQIANVCNLALSDILAVNPELPDATAVQPSDCIALPVPVVPPRIYVAQPGDSLPSIAKVHRVSMGRLLARNPELTDPTRLQPGWVVALPGLKGDSKCGVALQLLVAEAAAEAAAAGQATASWPCLPVCRRHTGLIEAPSASGTQQRASDDCQADTAIDLLSAGVLHKDVQQKGSDCLGAVAVELVPQDQNQPGVGTAAASSDVLNQLDNGGSSIDGCTNIHFCKLAGAATSLIPGKDELSLQNRAVGSGMFMFATSQSLA